MEPSQGELLLMEGFCIVVKYDGAATTDWIIIFLETRKIVEIRMKESTRKRSINTCYSHSE